MPSYYCEPEWDADSKTLTFRAVDPVPEVEHLFGPQSNKTPSASRTSGSETTHTPSHEGGSSSPVSGSANRHGGNDNSADVSDENQPGGDGGRTHGRASGAPNESAISLDKTSLARLSDRRPLDIDDWVGSIVPAVGTSSTTDQEVRNVG